MNDDSDFCLFFIHSIIGQIVIQHRRFGNWFGGILAFFAFSPFFLSFESFFHFTLAFCKCVLIFGDGYAPSEDVNKQGEVTVGGDGP